MNIKLDTETLAKLKAEIDEAQAKEKDPVAMAYESADNIRRSLVAVRGEDYADVVEIGVIVSKMMKLFKILADQAFKHMENPENTDLMLREIVSTMCAEILGRSSSLIQKEMTDAQAAEITDWIDRIIKAEDSVMDAIEQTLLKKGE